MFQVVTNPLTVEEGGERWLGAEHLLLLDTDSMEEALQVELQRGPRHGALQLGGLPLEPGQAFTVQDLKGLKVRSGSIKHNDSTAKLRYTRQCFLLDVGCISFAFVLTGISTTAQRLWRTTLNSLQQMELILPHLFCRWR